MHQIDSEQILSRAAEQLIREIAHQAVFDDDSMMAREVEYTGFGTAPLLSDSIFRSYHIVMNYDPFDWIFSKERNFTQSTIKRFRVAFEGSTQTLIAKQTFYQVQALNSAHRTFEAISMLCTRLQRRKSNDYGLIHEIGRCFQVSAALACKMERACSADTYEHLFQKNAMRKSYYSSDTLNTLVDNVFVGLEGIANDFRGHTDPFWGVALNMLREAFPRFSEEPDGMTPFQQRLAIKIIGKVRENMNGYYPAITRVMLALVGPYDSAGSQTNPTAFNLLRDAFYVELKSLRILALKEPDRIGDFFPENVKYEIKTDTLVHSYSGGSTASTNMRDLNSLVPLSLVHPAHLRLRQPPSEPHDR